MTRIGILGVGFMGITRCRTHLFAIEDRFFLAEIAFQATT